MKKAAFLVMTITLLSKITGFVREIVLSYVYGASGITDAFLLSQTIPNTVFSFVSAGVATGFISMYSRVRQENDRLTADRFTSNLSHCLMLVSTVVVALVLCRTRLVVRLFASGFGGDTLDLAVSFTRITVFGVYFSALLQVYAGYLRIYENYLTPALIGLPMNLILISSFFLSTKTNIYVIAFGSLAATAAQMVFLTPFLGKTGYRHEFILSLKDTRLQEMFLLALPVILGVSANEVNVLVDRTMASRIAVGGISALNYARRLNDFVQGLVAVSITTVMFPQISQMAAQGNIIDLKRRLREAISTIVILMLPATVGAMLFASEIVSVLFGRGAFSGDAVAMTATALYYYSVGMLASGVRDVLARGFYALHDTKTPMANATIAVVLNIVLNIVLSRYMGIGGLAVATSISAIAAVVLLLVGLRRKIGRLGLGTLTKSLVKISTASLLMGGIARVCFHLLESLVGQSLGLIFSVVVGVIVYGLMVYQLGVPEVEQTVTAFKRQLRARLRTEHQGE